jgi:hypothetical protein
MIHLEDYHLLVTQLRAHAQTPPVHVLFTQSSALSQYCDVATGVDQVVFGHCFI